MNVPQSISMDAVTVEIAKVADYLMNQADRYNNANRKSIAAAFYSAMPLLVAARDQQKADIAEAQEEARQLIELADECDAMEGEQFQAIATRIYKILGMEPSICNECFSANNPGTAECAKCLALIKE